MTGVLRRSGEFGHGHMDRRSQTGADAGAVLPQAKERLGLPAARRGKAGSSPRGFGGRGEGPC